MLKKYTHFMYVPFTGLGLYNGYRGHAWLKNRIKIFKDYVVASLENQTCQDFVLWISWRFEDRNLPMVKELKEYLDTKTKLQSIFTYNGVCFWDDKYDDETARKRLLDALRDSTIELFNHLGEIDHVIMTIQPSDDCYNKDVVKEIQDTFKTTDYQAFGYRAGYIANYLTGEVAEYNPKTIPPFFSIKFDAVVFKDPFAHAEYTGPYKSHEYIGDKLKYKGVYDRKFCVGTHTENISTNYNIPYKGRTVEKEVLVDFGIYKDENLKISVPLWKRVLKKLPHRVQRKLRYYIGEKIYAPLYRLIKC